MENSKGLRIVSRDTAIRTPRKRNAGDVIVAHMVNFTFNLGKQISIIFASTLLKSFADFITKMGDEKAQSIFNTNLNEGSKDYRNRATTTSRPPYYQSHDSNYYEKYASGYGNNSFPGLQ